MRRWVLPVIAAIFLTFSFVHMARTNTPPPDPVLPVEPPRSPYPDALAAAGIVEPQSENISVGTIVPGVVVEVGVTEGQRVRKDDLLFRLDDRQQRAELGIREAEVTSARADLERLKALPRPEDLPPSAAKVAAARADVAAQRDQMDRAEELVAKKVWTEQDLFQRQQNFAMARARLEDVEAEDQKLRAGAWKYEIAVAEAAVLRSQRQVEQTRIELDRLQTKAPIDGTILKVDIRVGEFVGAPPGQPLVILGAIDTLHVRVDIDEQDVPRFRPGLPGHGYLRGDAVHAFDLEFVRVEPYTQPKRSLTGAGNERVDTRVMQVIYRVKPTDRPVYVGQQMDVFLDLSARDGNAAASSSSAGVSPAGGAKR